MLVPSLQTSMNAVVLLVITVERVMMVLTDTRAPVLLATMVSIAKQVSLINYIEIHCILVFQLQPCRHQA